MREKIVIITEAGVKHNGHLAKAKNESEILYL